MGGSAVGTVGVADGAAPVSAPGGAGRACGPAGRRGPVRSAGVLGPRLLVSRPAPCRGDRVRRLLAGLALVLAAAAVVVGLGRVADAAGQSRAAEAPAAVQVSGVGVVTVTVTAPSTVWEVADRVLPGASGPQRAALVDRIVVANSLTSLRVGPGTVLRVPL
jgi:hypothetical protein